MGKEHAAMGHASPILRVNDIDASLAYYTSTLGFALKWRAESFLCVARGNFSLFLCEGEQGHPGMWIWIAVEDSDALYAEWTASGARIRQKPTNFPWGSRELQVTDLDGHVMRFGADLKEGEPMGEFMNMDGELHPLTFKGFDQV